MHRLRRTVGNPETLGLIYGVIGVVAFSLTLPFTRVAVAAFGAMPVGLGRVTGAAILAAIYLATKRQPFPRRDLGGLLIVAAGVVFGFPLLSAWAMGKVPAAHGAVILGLQPLATAGAAALLVGERPSRIFWFASLAGSAIVVLFAARSGAGLPQTADLALLGAGIAAAFGYAEGARLSRHLGGLEVISWALLLGFPFVAWPAVRGLMAVGAAAPLSAWGALAYVIAVSQFLGFTVWYRGLAMGGVAKVGQTQLLQPFFTILFSALFLGEPLSGGTFGTALVVAVCVAIGRNG